jgi:hypothetical protein
MQVNLRFYIELERHFRNPGIIKGRRHKGNKTQSSTKVLQRIKVFLVKLCASVS